MNASDQQSLSLKEGRFARLESIEWWNQSLLAEARALLVGAGALGNEVAKNLSLLGLGNLIIADMDRIEMSNLSRSVLFREQDEGKPKAERAARAAQEIYPQIKVKPIVGNVLADIGLGYFRWAQVVIGALDNREARVFVNSACARVGRPWIDGGIEVLQGIARGFAPPATACYECTMSQTDWDLLNRRRSCSLLARRAIEHRGVPTTPTTASVIAGIQAQEVVKLLHGMDALLGRGFVFEGAHHNSYAVAYSIDPDCGWHEEPAPIESLAQFNSSSKLGDLWELAASRLGGLDAIELAREIVESLECPACGGGETVMLPVEKVDPERAICRVCNSEMIPKFFHSIAASSPLLEKTIAEIGLPAWEIVWGRKGADSLGLEMSGDNPF
jgi:adenylyltransferase/sulfurtransferase